MLLADGRRITSGTIRGVVNRLVGVPAAYLARAEEADRAYVEQEWRALLCSILHALGTAGVPVVDPPDPFFLGGRWRSPAEWALLAARAGFAVPAWRWRGGDPPPAGTSPSGSRGVVVVDGSVVAGERLPRATVDACSALARAANRRLLGLEVVPGTRRSGRARRPVLGDVQLMPDLERAGPATLDALAAVLRA